MFDKFRNLCDNHDLYMKRKVKGFPRKEGYCFLFDVSSSFSKNDKILDILEEESDEAELFLLEASKIILKEKFDMIRWDGI